MQNKTEEIVFFDSWSESKIYREFGHFTPYGHNSIIREFEKLIGARLKKGCRAIDLGCGAGAFTRRLFAHSEAECYGVDISQGLVRAACEFGNGVHYMVGDIEQLSFRDNTFDVVIFSGVLHHFPQQKKCLEEGFRILKKGGCLIAYDPNIKNPFMWFYKEGSAALFSKQGQTENEKIFSKQEAESMLKMNGFKNVKISCISGVTFKYVGSRAGMLLLPVYNGIEYLLGKLPLASSYGSFLISYGEK